MDTFISQIILLLGSFKSFITILNFQAHPEAENLHQRQYVGDPIVNKLAFWATFRQEYLKLF